MFQNGSATKEIGRFFDLNWLLCQRLLINGKINYCSIIGM